MCLPDCDFIICTWEKISWILHFVEVWMSLRNYWNWFKNPCKMSLEDMSYGVLILRHTKSRQNCTTVLLYNDQKIFITDCKRHLAATNKGRFTLYHLGWWRGWWRKRTSGNKKIVRKFLPKWQKCIDKKNKLIRFCHISTLCLTLNSL